MMPQAGQTEYKRLQQLDKQIVACERCARLRKYCRQIGRQKRASYRNWTYWAQPVPNFGDPRARLLIIGLAPAAHGANRTGRMFTGDRSGDFLYRAMHATGFANQDGSVEATDGLALRDALITATCHCAPPDNKPTKQELANCNGWLDKTFKHMRDLRVVLCLGRLSLDAVLDHYKRRGLIASRTGYPFGHGTEHRIEGGVLILCSFHPSQQNTFTGRLTPAMLAAIFRRAARMIEGQ